MRQMEAFIKQQRPAKKNAEPFASYLNFTFNVRLKYLNFPKVVQSFLILNLKQLILSN
jgi:hypothetical protein